MGFLENIPFLNKKKKKNHYIKPPKALESSSRRDFLKTAGKGTAAAAGAALAGIGAYEAYKHFSNRTDSLTTRQVIRGKVPEPDERQEDAADFEDSEDAQAINEIFRHVNIDEKIEITMASIEATKRYWIEMYEKEKKRDLAGAIYRMRFWSKPLQEQFARWEKQLTKNGVKTVCNQTGYSPRHVFLCSIPESYWRLYDESPTGAKGPFQFMPDTADTYDLKMIPGKIDQRFDPLMSGQACMEYYEYLLSQFNNSLDLAAAGYNGAYIWAYRKYKGDKKELNSLSYPDFIQFCERDVNNLRIDLKDGHYTTRYGDTWTKIYKLFDAANQPNIKAALDAFRQEHQDKKVPPRNLRIKLPEMETARLNKFLRRYLEGYKENINYPAKIYAAKEVMEKQRLEDFFPPTKVPFMETTVKGVTDIYMVDPKDTSLQMIRQKIAKKHGVDLASICSQADLLKLNPGLSSDGKLENVLFHAMQPIKYSVTTDKRRCLADFVGNKQQAESELKLLKTINPSILDDQYILPVGYPVRQYLPSQISVIAEAERAFQEAKSKPKKQPDKKPATPAGAKLVIKQ